MFISIGKAAKLLGVCVKTLRNWEERGLLKPSHRTNGGHRRFCFSEIQTFYSDREHSENEKLTLCYARVSSHDQKEDLQRQIDTLETYCKQQKFESVMGISDLGSGIKMNKPGLKKLLHLILKRKVRRLVLCHKDRLLRFGADLIFQICRFFEVEVRVIEEQKAASFEEDLARDVVSIITVFTAKLYGRRSHEKRKLRQKMQAAA